MSTPPENTAALASLCPELRSLLAAELAAGNPIAEVTPRWSGEQSCLVLLKKPFQVAHATLPLGVVYREVNDPHWWKAEYFHAETKSCLACRF